jgi:hypothetical protein
MQDSRTGTGVEDTDPLGLVDDDAPLVLVDVWDGVAPTDVVTVDVGVPVGEAGTYTPPGMYTDCVTEGVGVYDGDNVADTELEFENVGVVETELLLVGETVTDGDKEGVQDMEFVNVPVTELLFDIVGVSVFELVRVPVTELLFDVVGLVDTLLLYVGVTVTDGVIAGVLGCDTPPPPPPPTNTLLLTLIVGVKLLEKDGVGDMVFVTVALTELEFDTVAADVTLFVTVAETELELLIVGETDTLFVTVDDTELELLVVGDTV